MLVYCGDVSNDDDVSQCFEKIRSQWGGIDLLVNNAGTATMSPLTSGEPKDWRKTLDINVAAPAHCIQRALRDMAGRDEGQIINISSIYAHRDQVANFALYQASKSALRSLTNTLRAELAAAGSTIRVGMISPGMVATEFRAQATGGEFAYESYFEEYEPILPEDVVGAVLYMLSTRPHIQVQDILLSPLGQGL
jgi:NADP-dependent 3-hydroxy acid dehydrogenase YdfG